MSMPETIDSPAHPTGALAGFAATLRYADIPPAVLDRGEDLFLDWAGSALAGGPSEVLISRRGTSPLFAAMANGAASHVAEQDDVYNGSVFHPGTVVFPAALAVVQAREASGRDLLAAAVAG